MGVATRRHFLPAPTDSSAVESAEEATDIATDLSLRTDLTSHTVPDDGSPITITTGKKRSTSSKLAKPNTSQTSLLIEYFEGGTGLHDSSRQPSVRVKVTPSSGRKSRDRGDSHIVVTEARGTRKTSTTQRISLGASSPAREVDEESYSSLETLGQIRKRRPLEVEVLERDGSDLSGSHVSQAARYIEPTSDISSMPADSLLGVAPVAMAKAERSRSRSGEEEVYHDTLKAPVYPQQANASRERLTQKVIEKLSARPRVASGSGRTRQSNSRSRSASREIEESETVERRRRSGRHRDEAPIEASAVTGSMLSADGKSGDQRSFRSTTSHSSINNPRLLATVEDAIRRLILPEIEEVKKNQRVASAGRSKFDREVSVSDRSGSSVSREHRRRHLSRSENTDVAHQRDRQDAREILSSGRRKHESRHKDVDMDSPSERSYRRESGDSLSVDENVGHGRRPKEHRLRDAAAGALVGGVLTAAALKHHDSSSTIERRRRRKKRSKSRSSQSASVAESEEIFHKHEVPPMPMRSEVDSELTRSSLLSSQTGETLTPTHQEVREVYRSSPREVLSPAAVTPTRSPVPHGLKHALGTHHGNFSEQDLSIHKDDLEHEVYEDPLPKYGSEALAGAAGGMGVLAANQLLDPERARAYENNLHHQHPIRRGLSPIQSVASYTTTEPNRNSILHPRSNESLNSPEKQHQVREQESTGSFASASSINQAKSNRPRGISLENRSEIMGQHVDNAQHRSRDLDVDDFYDAQHAKNEAYRDSYDSGDPRIPAGQMTDDGFDSPYLDKVTAGQQVARGHGANPEYIHMPPDVESAVASLYDPSLADEHGNYSPSRSYQESLERRDEASPRGVGRSMVIGGPGSPLKQYQSASAQPEPLIPRKHKNVSPPHSETRSIDKNEAAADKVVSTTKHVQPTEDQAAASPESEITTNPSVIQGPIGGIPHENRDHWPYDPTPPIPKAAMPSSMTTDHHREAAATALTGAATGAALSRDLDLPAETYMSNRVAITPPNLRDEGYITAENPRSPGPYTPNGRGQGAKAFSPIDPAGDPTLLETEDDPFTTNNRKYLSGFSQGLSSPLYDNATGKGIDRIHSKDIVALMDHLTVRDGQRQARDTEILVTLVRTATEMRNSFEDMKKFIIEQDDLIMDTADDQHEKTQKIIGGPRPLPVGSSQYQRRAASEADEDLPAKRKNVFKRALQGLGSKNSQELQNIEGMLLQLLGTVEDLRSAQNGGAVAHHVHGPSLNSVENVRAPTDPGYEPEGQAGTSSTGDRSGFSINSSRQTDYRGAVGGARDPANRVSTVMEGDEDYEPLEPHEDNILNQQPTNESYLLTPTRGIRDMGDTPQAGAVPFSSEPRGPAPYSTYNENTPQSDGKNQRKSKAISSSFFPKMLSRWSKTTTASTIPDNLGSSAQNTPKSRPYSQVSQPGEQDGQYEYDHTPGDQFGAQENRPPSPLVPSQVSDNPKYQAVRNSMNLQHPQPRQGPTDRYQHHLESEAQYYGHEHISPTSQTSSHWENQAALNSIDPNVTNRSTRRSTGNGKQSPISDHGYSDTSSIRSGPPPPPKDNGEPLVPPRRTPQGSMTTTPGRQATYVDHVAAARGGSPGLDKSPVAAMRSSPAAPGRKPSGPRPDVSSGSFKKSGIRRGDMGSIKRTRFRGSPNQIDSDEDFAPN